MSKREAKPEEEEEEEEEAASADELNWEGS